MLTTPKDAYIPQQFKVLVYSIVDAQPFPLFIQNCYRTSNLHKVLDYLTGISLPSSLQDQWVGEDTLIIFVFYDIHREFFAGRLGEETGIPVFFEIMLRKCK